jgi:enamine deaminase RidA (YjgF/YER057c/UK114 family)
MIERTEVPGLGQPPGYSHVVVASGGRLVTTAGAVPLGPADCVAQAKQVLDNLTLAPGSVGAKGSDVLKTTVYVATENREDLAAVWRVIQGSEVADAASTLLGVSSLGYEGQLVEIEAIAVLE